jgi:hypothetical protein
MTRDQARLRLLAKALAFCGLNQNRTAFTYTTILRQFYSTAGHIMKKLLLYSALLHGEIVQKVAVVLSRWADTMAASGKRECGGGRI